MATLTGKAPYYTIKHFADINGISVQTVYRRIRNNELETRKLNGLTFVRKKAKL